MRRSLRLWQNERMIIVRRTTVLLTALLASSTALAQTVSKSPCSTSAQRETSTWRVYADWDHHFCFRYPGSYRSLPPPKIICREAKLRNEVTKAEIGVCVLPDAFRLSALQTMAPTGIDSPPGSIRIGNHTFYYYGPGGGGVSYPDGYYYNLRGKILVIDFDGPYENDNTPTPETKKMETKVLASFREF